MKTKIILFAVTVAAFALTTARADALNINISGEIRLGHRPPPPPPEVVVVVQDPDDRRPGPWEHRSWYQRTQAYYYYPGSDAYYRPSDHTWFYSERGQWRSGRNLPDWVRVDFDRSVTVSMATDRPYMFHEQIVTRYPANYFGGRVRLKSDDRHDRDDHGRDDHGRDNDDHRHDKDDHRDDHRDDRDHRP